VLDPARPTEGSCAALLQFENGAAASLVYSGYDYFDSDEWHFNISERGAPKKLDHGAARRALLKTADETSARTETFAYGSRKADLPAHQPHFGITIATCEKAELRASADGLTEYGPHGPSKINIERGPGMPGRHQVLDEMDCALRLGIRPVHDGRWGKATLEVALAIQRSAQKGREVALAHQVPVREEEMRAAMAAKSERSISMRIADWPSRGIYAKD
jgi:phthalate 4,5-cis-dihydrodiol dehydrogenase